MSALFTGLRRGNDEGRMTRRRMLLALPALVAAPRLGHALSQPSSSGPIAVRNLNHMTLTVKDPKRSIEFYQGLFGMPIQARQGPTTVLRIGGGPQFVAINGGPNATPRIDHYCLTVQNFNVDRLMKVLADNGVTPVEAGANGGGLSGGPMKSRVRMRGPDAGGAKEGSPEIYFGDPDGIVIQLQDPKYCGGAGVLGEMCLATPEPAPTKGLLAVRDLSHFTIRVSDAQRTGAFYQKLFGLKVRSMQGPTPGWAIGSGVQFVMFTAAPVASATGGAPPRPPAIDHVCMNMTDFNVDSILKTLEGYGIKPRGSATGPVGPMTSYVSMRMENRGGAKDGTPELYFTDPDGLLIQLQDVKYCGGGGYLGDVCPA
jgi:catechol 2,3-dioxygenase-like lactoylglutathione lyase family enzyme